VIAWLLRGLCLPARWAVAGAASAGVIGAIVGLAVGLRVYAPTAGFAVVELGIPAAIVGGVLGLAAGVIVTAVRRPAPVRTCSR
jgi:fructose-specific phosphotransferase system IIC component